MPSASEQIAPPVSGGNEPQKLGLVEYTWAWFQATRWSLWLWIPFALLLVALSSFLKPVVDSRGLFYSAATMAGVSSLAMLLFAAGRVGAYMFKRQRTLPPKPRSRMAKIAYGGFVCSILMLALAAVERFTPPEGLLVSYAEPLRGVQSKLAALILNASESPELIAVVEDDAAVIEADEDQPDSSGIVEAKTTSVESKISSADVKEAVALSSSSDVAVKREDETDQYVSGKTEQQPIDASMQQLKNQVGKTSPAKNDVTDPPSEPGGSFSLQPTSDDLGGKRQGQYNLDSSATIKLSTEASESEASTEFDNLSTSRPRNSELMPPRSPEDVCEPGGAFSEQLTVPRGAKTRSSYSKIKPGGSF